ncbi:MAG: hypothetical protein KatS3mg038_2153 [Candidatus Kapaibacterium sp.]|nr:MAG: hypothetical protein KatS3mg038_2153 [Candidatus Kapabacteria bacterium]
MKFDFRSVEIPRLENSPGRGEFYRYGQDNLYPYFLNYLLQSPVHKGIITTKVYYIVAGKKIEPPKGAVFFLADNMDWQQFLEALAADYEVANQCYLTVMKVPNGYEIGHMPYSKVRVGTRVGEYVVSDDWTKSTGRIVMKDLSLYNKDEAKFYERFLYRISAPINPAFADYGKGKKVLTSLVYPAPVYDGGIYAILADIETLRYQYNEIANSFKGGTLVELPDIFDSEEKRLAIAQRIKEELTSVNAEAGIVVSFKPIGSDAGATIQSVAGSDTAQRYSTIRQDIITSIVIAHSVTSPELIGVAIPSQLGGTTSREESYAIFEQTYISGRRKAIVAGLNTAFGIIGYPPVTVSEASSALQTGGGQPETSMSVALGGVVDVVELFARCGRPRHAYTYLDDAPVVGHDDWHAFLKTELPLREEFAARLTDKDVFVLQLVQSGADFGKIVEALGSTLQATTRISRLISMGYLKKAENNQPMRLTIRGMLQLVGKQNLSVVYTYQERPDAPPLLTRSRPFCRRMLALNKAYTREEIDRISSIIGRDVWLYRGGWYYNWQTGKEEPACRHEWRQHLVVV